MPRIHWPVIRDSLLKGTYWECQVRRVMILKLGESEHKLGIPMVTKRLMQRVLLHVLTRSLIDFRSPQLQVSAAPGCLRSLSGGQRRYG